MNQLPFLGAVYGLHRFFANLQSFPMFFLFLFFMDLGLSSHGDYRGLSVPIELDLLPKSHAAFFLFMTL